MKTVLQRPWDSLKWKKKTQWSENGQRNEAKKGSRVSH